MALSSENTMQEEYRMNLFGGGDGFMGTYTCQNSKVHFKHVWFTVHQSYRNKTGKILHFKSFTVFPT